MCLMNFFDWTPRWAGSFQFSYWHGLSRQWEYVFTYQGFFFLKQTGTTMLMWSKQKAFSALNTMTNAQSNMWRNPSRIWGQSCVFWKWDLFFFLYKSALLLWCAFLKKKNLLTLFTCFSDVHYSLNVNRRLDVILSVGMACSGNIPSVNLRLYLTCTGGCWTISVHKSICHFLFSRPAEEFREKAVIEGGTERLEMEKDLFIALESKRKF